MKFHQSLVWFRRDLRHFDHAALHHALLHSERVFCVFVFDQAILDGLPRRDRRVEFIHASILELDAELRKAGGCLLVRHGLASHEIPRLAAQLDTEAVFANHDYEPEAVRRDAEVAAALHAEGRAWMSFKDQVIFEKNEVLSQSGKPFSIFTPYKNAWLKTLHLDESVLSPYQTDLPDDRLARSDDIPDGGIPSLSDLGFMHTDLHRSGIPSGMSGGQLLFDAFSTRIQGYGDQRDFPAVQGTSCLSVHLRFGTVSIRGLVRHAVTMMRQAGNHQGASTWLSELIWRDFYFMILHHHPHVVERAFKSEYDAIQWQTGPKADDLFHAWCDGRTGYPLVDAAMCQLNQTGYMHNRLRMVTASFLIKDLGIDWHRGERYFAERLNDYDLAANNGGWQWAASSGCDAQPYFRIFNPVTQSEKFDPEGKFIKNFLPQLAGLPPKRIHAPWLVTAEELKRAGITLGTDYPVPVVSHEEARKRTLERYAVVKTARSYSDSGE